MGIVYGNSPFGKIPAYLGFPRQEFFAPLCEFPAPLCKFPAPLHKLFNLIKFDASYFPQRELHIWKLVHILLYKIQLGIL